MEKIGILGGTFNPIHYGHLMISEYLRDELNLDKVIYVPTGYSPHKINSISADIRYKMVEIAIKNNENFQISDVEAKSGKISYSVNTVKKLKENHPGEYFFLIGSDTIFQLKTWRKLEELSKEVHFVAALRPEYLERDKIDEEIKFLKNNFNTQITIINGPLYQVSSTELRDRMKTKKSVRYLIPDEVIRFIRENNLYRDE
ncbi:nicotinate-nucleotide adenylyltransferase [Peptoniphilus lacrimalis]|uniref:nicotinate-nucleotide adenylyltransferase n=1 Tax=Peptoniphilus lacrimalis TaxID=33031 RepID=UPI002549D417|nr:nicotinate-nucleotide adenylyltransferase [Peptoniphilus lacrimalis]MDK7721630.1 nicotinate-nucleotide adenylyltransferase [Peptoniphilus lacrimalis]MDK7731232.1 nicotinate-nucleotide adenylyltransferase [Peptoniphilus lacrimalis]